MLNIDTIKERMRVAKEERAAIPISMKDPDVKSQFEAFKEDVLNNAYNRMFHLTTVDERPKMPKLRKVKKSESK